jgi:hypothetical protein
MSHLIFQFLCVTQSTIGVRQNEKIQKCNKKKIKLEKEDKEKSNKK